MPRRPHLLALILAASPLAPSPAQAQVHCLSRWLPSFRSDYFGVVHPLASAPGRRIGAIVVFDDDGDGPNPPMLCIAGTFNHGAGTRVRSFTRFDGTDWRPIRGGVGTGSEGGLGEVRAMCVFDDDAEGPIPPALYLGGAFSHVSNNDYPSSEWLPAPFIAKWDGAQWAPAGTGLPYRVDDLIAFDPDGDGPQPAALHAASGQGVYRLGPDGVWTRIGQIAASSLAVFDPDADGPQAPKLFAGSSGLWRLEADQWVQIPGAGNLVDIEVVDEDGTGPAPAALFAAGIGFAGPDGPYQGVARYDGAAWTPIAATGNVESLASHDPDGDGPAAPVLTIGGSFWSISPQPGQPGSLAPGFAVWQDQSLFAPPVRLSSLGAVYAMEWFDPDADGPAPGWLYVGGSFTTVGVAPDVLPVYSLMRWDGAAFSRIGDGPSNYQNRLHPGRADMAVFDADGDGPAPPKLIVAGAFAAAGNTLLRSIAAWNGQAWSPLGDGLSLGTDPGEVSALAVWDDNPDDDIPAALYAAGRFTTSGSTPLSRIARWNGTEWSPLASGIVGSVYDLETLDPDGDGPQPSVLLAGGQLTSAGGIPASALAQWDGEAWSVPSPQPGYPVHAMQAFDEDGDGTAPPRLWLTNLFTTYVYDGAHVQQHGTASLPFADFAVFDADGTGPRPPALYGLRGVELYRYRGGIDWEVAAGTLAGGLWVCIGPCTGVPPTKLQVLDDGSGESLWISGAFTRVAHPDGSSDTTPLLARWNGSKLLPVNDQFLFTVYGPSSRPGVLALANFDADGPGGDPPAIYIYSQAIHNLGGVPCDSLARFGRLASDPAAITQHPRRTSVVPDNPATFTVATSGETPLTYRWRKDGVDLADDGRISGSSTASLTVAAARWPDEGLYDCIVSFPSCAEVRTDPGRLIILCSADWDGNHAVDSSDISSYLTVWLRSLNPVYGNLIADFNADMQVNSTDISAFLTAWLDAVTNGC